MIDRDRRIETAQRLHRRVVLQAIGTAFAALAVAACGESVSDSAGGSGGSGGKGGASGGGSGSGGSGSAGTGGAGGSTTPCEITPEGEIGPYFTDDSDPRYNRSDIRTNIDGTSRQTGVPLTLTVHVVDTEDACAPYANAQIDIWHCNAEGVYSNESVEDSVGESWLRGYQVTDAKGMVTFTTIMPGWYQGRTTHIHLRVRSKYSSVSSTSDGSNTTQVFFAQSLVDGLATNVAPYAAEGVNNTTNASDHVYTQETHGEMLLSATGNVTDGYAASCTIGLPITDS